MTTQSNKSPMGKAFASVRGAIQRGDATELRCKKTWLERVIREPPNTVFANEAEIGLKIINGKPQSL